MHNRPSRIVFVMEVLPALWSLPHGGAFIGPSVSSFFPAVRVSNCCHLSARAVSREAKAEPASTSTSFVPKWRYSKSFLARKSALAEVQESSNLNSSLERIGGILKAQDLNVLIGHFGKLKRWQDLSQLFDWMQQHGKTNISSYSNYIKFMGKYLSPIKALDIYHTIPDESARVNTFICNSILSCLVKNGKFESSINTFDEMKRDGLLPDVVTYNTLLSGCIKVKNGYTKALELVKELKYHDLQMDSVMYGTLLAICASNNLCMEAQNYFNQMTAEGHTPNVYHYSALLNAYSSDGNYKRADELVQEMKSLGLVLNKVTLTTLLKVYVRGGLFEKSKALLAELEALGYAEDEMPYCLLMDSLSKAGHIDEARTIFDKVQKSGVRSDGYSHSIMIAAFCRAGHFEDAKNLAQDFEVKYTKYDVVLLNTMLCAYCRAGEMQNVMKIMKKMDDLLINPDHNTYHILIKYFCKEKEYLLAYRTMKDMHSKGHELEEELCTLLVLHLGKLEAYTEALSVYNMLKYSKRNICKALHERILRILVAGRLLKDAYIVVKDNADSISKPAIKKFIMAFVKFGNINLINDVLKVIHGSGYKIDQGVFQMAISQYMAQPEKKYLLLQMLQWMPGQGYAVDSSTRNLILQNSDLFGRQLIAEIMSNHRLRSKQSKPA